MGPTECEHRDTVSAYLLGALTAEFFALGLDPYPRKPGVEFAAPAEEAAPDSPFAALAGRRAKK